MLKQLMFVPFLVSWACARPPEAEAPNVEMAELRDENRRLQQELAQLKQRQTEPHDEVPCTPSKLPGEGEDEHEDEAVAAAEAAPIDGGEGKDSAPAVREGPKKPQLPIVKLSPDASPGEGDEGISIRESVPAEEDLGPEGTRPVLRVQGKHEAWVYHRPIDDDGDALTQEPGSTPAPSAKAKVSNR